MDIHLADYLISAIHYCPEEGHIEQIYVHENKDDDIGEYTSVSPQWVVKMINLGYVFSTVTESEEGHWVKGENVIVENIDGVDYIKLETRSNNSDNFDCHSLARH